LDVEQHENAFAIATDLGTPQKAAFRAMGKNSMKRLKEIVARQKEQMLTELDRPVYDKLRELWEAIEAMPDIGDTIDD
jgi:hypothetical protein